MKNIKLLTKIHALSTDKKIKKKIKLLPKFTITKVITVKVILIVLLITSCSKNLYPPKIPHNNYNKSHI